MKEKIKRAIQKSGKTAYRIAKEANISQAILSCWCSGKRRPTSLICLARFCKAVNCKIEDIIDIGT